MHFKGLTKEAAGKVNAGLFLTDGSLIDRTKSMFESSGLQVNVAKKVNGSGMLSDNSSQELGELGLVVYDLSQQRDLIPAARELVERCRSDAAVVVIGRENDVGLYRELRMLGVGEYFTHPAEIDDLLLSARRLTGLAGTERGQGRFTTIYGVQAGVGSGVITAGLSVFLSQEYGRDVVALDADLASPTVGNYLGADVPGDIGILLEAGERLDHVLVRQAIQKPSERLGLLHGLASMGDELLVEPQAVARLGRVLDSQYRYQLWRCHGASVLRAKVLNSSDVVIMVTGGSLACVRSAQMTLRFLNDHNPAARLITIYNHVSPHQSIPPLALAKSLGLTLSYVVPYFKKLGDDLVTGTSFVSKGHSFYKVLVQLTKEVMGQTSPTGRSNLKGSR
ncbi:MAG: hypothetical protein LBT47_12185 [Deltaproteobacteria bacterium]|jgi:pilus assembly protein CpaE|nr:hypothetical protein [Deltaproteobacteria bacterium]